MMNPMCSEAQGWGKGTRSLADLNAYVGITWGHRIGKTCVLWVCVWDRSGGGRGRKEKRERESHGLLGSNLETNEC